jgi:uncharacterized alpha-E superfamily protein
MLDLLVRDAAHPRALAFQWHAIAGDLGALAGALGVRGESGLEEAMPQISDADLMMLEGDDPEALAARDAMAERLRSMAWAASLLSDRLSLRHFSHISLDMHALAT